MRAFLAALALLLPCACGCRTVTVDGGDDGGQGVADAGATVLHVLDVDPPRGWADGGPISWRLLSFEELCRGVSDGRLAVQINERGTALIGCHLDGDLAGELPEDTLVLSSGAKFHTTAANYTQFLMDDDSYWHMSEAINAGDWSIYRRRLDGGVISKLRYKKVFAASLSGWLALEHWGDMGSVDEVHGPDAGVWTARTILSFNELGYGVGQNTQDRRDLQIWKDGQIQTATYDATGSYGNSINEANLIAGMRFVGARKAAMFWGRQFHDIALSEGDSSEATAVNNSGIAVGNSQDSQSQRRFLGWGFAWARGQSIILDEVMKDAGVDCLILTAQDINDSNQVVGLARCNDAGVSYYRLRIGVE